ncbi:MAG TPA: NAD(P)H nitroreductase [Candidatus Omnitrophica bacterium]|nr:NAD(P)H nitroreductase [Candidatus Omnitrophota bacterium]
MLLDLIQKRQSSRDCLPKPVPRELIEKCIEAARLAPSACNSQPWHFIIVDEPALKEKLAEKIFSGPYAMNSFAKKAPVIIAVISEKSSFMAKIGGYFRGTAYYLMDIGIAVEHFILQAAELGLGTCWIGWFNERETKRLLGVPAAKKIDCIITLGYSQEPLRAKNRKPAKEIYSYNEYRGENT